MGAEFLSSRAIIGNFFWRLEQNIGARWIDLVSMLFQSDQESETYNWLGMAPAMRRWVGGRNPKGFRKNGITITNLEYEATMEVLRKELRRDKWTQIRTRINEMADRANAHWASLLSALIIAGETDLCYDGQAFFDTDHVEGESGTQSNDITYNVGTPTAPTAAEMELAIFSAITQMLSFKDDQGEPMNEGATAFRVQVPIPLFPSALAAVKSATIVDASGSRQNTLAASEFSLEVDPNTRLTPSWTDKFAVFRVDGNVKPLIRQEEEPVDISAIAEGSELEFKENLHWYGTNATRNVGYGYWQQACLVTLT